MATYIGIKGVEIQTIAGDPANPIEGQVWYNTTANTLKGYGLQGTGAWGSEASMLNQRGDCGGCGLLTAAIVMGGYNQPTTTTLDKTESYDGTSWTEVNALLNVVGNVKVGQGTQGAAMKVITNVSPKKQTEEWDGTCWAAGGSINTYRAYAGGAGTQTAGMTVAGNTNGTTYTTACEEYNGSSWTTVNACNTGRNYSVNGGTQAGAIMAGGLPTGTTAAESYDGTTWTNIADVGSGNAGYGSNNGSSSAFIDATGRNTSAGQPTVAAEEFNGSTWSAIADVSAKNQGGAGVGTAFAMMKCTGSYVPTTACESYEIPLATKTFTSS